MKGSNYKNILNEIRTIYKENYGEDNIDIIEVVLNDVIDLFYGKRNGFQKCDTEYHDLFHTLQVIPPFIGIIDGWNKSKNIPSISKEFFDLGIITVLLHDTGYIKTEDDIDGSGAKYTFTHVKKSSDFAGFYLPRIGLEKHKISAVQNIIMCTGMKINVDNILFNSEEERIIGYTLGTADLLGQMSDIDYLEKLPLLYNEFEEAYYYEGIEKLRERGATVYESAEDLKREAPHFYEIEVKGRLKKLGSMYKYLTYHFRDSRNYYIEAIEENMKRIKLSFILQ